MDSEEEVEVSGDKRELQDGEAPRTKRVKTLTLTADGKWEEEEESVEFSESEDEKPSTSTGNAQSSQGVKSADIPLLWSGNMLPSNQAQIDSDSDESEEGFVAWSWMKKPQAEPVDVVENIEGEEDVHPDACERTSSTRMQADAVTLSQDDSNLSDADACPDEQLEAREDVEEGDDGVDDADLQQDMEADIAEEPAMETGTEVLGYAPGKLLAWLLQPADAADAQSESESEDSEEDSDSDSFPDEVRERLSANGNPLAEPKRMPRPPAPSSARPLEPIMHGSEGWRERRRKAIRQMPKLRGSIRLCFPGAAEDMPFPRLGQRIQNDGTAPDDEQTIALSVLARHTVRLGPRAGHSLETAVMMAVKRIAPDSADFARWEFIVKERGLKAYAEEKLRVRSIYRKYPFDLKRADEESRKLLPVGVPTCSPEVKGADAGPAFIVRGKVPCMVNLPIPELRFAHDSQREHFGHKASKEFGEVRRSVLQLAVEMLTGTTSPQSVPTFRACLHKGLWYCYTGNRRLAAFRLAHRFAPERFGRVQLPMVAADEKFLKGTTTCQQRLTTSRNGAECNGRWLLFLETGEAVGRALPGCNEYGCDLLSLLPKLEMPTPTPQASANSAAVAQGSAAGSAQGNAGGGTPTSQDAGKVKADLDAATAGA